jgi:hypothetical integral membrane protein (TIGR02206 family)
VRQLSPEHVAAVVVTLVVAAQLAWTARRRGERWAAPASRALAVVIAAAYVAEYLANALDGSWSARVNLPLHLTDAATLVAIAALATARQALVEVLYFWAFTASLQALLTPDLGQAFPSIFYFTYMITHGGAVVAACLLVFGRGIVPRAGAVWRVYGLTAAFAALAGLGDLLTGGNYMFLRAKPEQASALDVMGPWPWYIATGAAVALALFLALAALARRQRSNAALTRPGAPDSVA